MNNSAETKNQLGQETEYVTTYTPSLLAPIPRATQRGALGIAKDPLPFRGFDIWNAYEFTWLNSRGKPEVALAQIQVPSQSANIIESKSLKLYLGSYSGTKFGLRAEVVSALEADLALVAGTPVSVTLLSPEQVQHNGIVPTVGQSLDLLDIDVDEYDWNPDFLVRESDTTVRESLYTNLFMAKCPMTGQPDCASVMIQYHGASISHEGILKYLISYREHSEFAEQIAERIFVDLMIRCAPDTLTVQARFSRRGGIDINPYRSHEENMGPDARNWRQ